MTTTSTLKPGDLVRHPEHGNGIIALGILSGEPRIIYIQDDADEVTPDFTDWERVEVVKPGHVQVRIDDLELGPLTSRTEEEFVAAVGRDFPEYSEGDRRLIYRALAAQTRDEQPDEPQEFGARVTVTHADGHVERWLNMHTPPQGCHGWLTWDARDTFDRKPGQSKWADWDDLLERGTVTIGWA